MTNRRYSTASRALVLIGAGLVLALVGGSLGALEPRPGLDAFVAGLSLRVGLMAAALVAGAIPVVALLSGARLLRRLFRVAPAPLSVPEAEGLRRAR